MDDEPDVNISGGPGGGGAFATVDPAEAGSRAEHVVDRLGELYWRKTYGGRDAFECLVRTVLSQNTSDQASQPAHDALMERYGGSDGDADDGDGNRADGDGDVDLAAALADADRSGLAEIISPAGLHNQKSRTLIALAERVCEEYGGAESFDEFVAESDPAAVREALLEMDGVGPKTADCVLLFAGGRAGVFPVDTHVHRIARRLGLAPPDADHETVREHLERDVPAEQCGFGRQDVADSFISDSRHDGSSGIDGHENTVAHGGVPPEKCGFGHTAMIQFGREYCTARNPACLDGTENCPLSDLCERVGIDEEKGTAVDPSEAVD